MQESIKKSKHGALKKFLSRYQDGPKSLERGKFICCFLFVIIPIIHFFIFYVVANFNSFYLAFTKFAGYDGNNNEIYVFSFESFAKVFDALKAKDSGLSVALKNTFTLFILHGLQLVCNFFIAYTFTRNLRGAKFFRVMLYLPSIISTMVLAIVIKNLVDDGGPLSMIWVKFSSKEFPLFFSDDKTAYPALMTYCIWAGFYQYLLIFEGSIRRVPQEVLESARLDGVSVFQELVLIIVPIMWDTISTIIILCVCSLFTISAPILLFTDGANNTQTLSFWFYQQVIEYPSTNSMNISAAAGLIITAINLPIVFGVRALMNKINHGIEY